MIPKSAKRASAYQREVTLGKAKNEKKTKDDTFTEEGSDRGLHREDS